MANVSDIVDNEIGPGNGEISLITVSRFLLDKWYWMLLAGAVTGLAVFLVVRYLVTPSYQSSVSFYVYNSPDSVTNTKSVNDQDLQAAESLATTYANILESNTMLDAVLDNAGSEGKGLTRKELGGMTEAFVISNTQLLEVDVSSSDPELARKLAQSFERVAPKELQRITKVGGVEIVDQPELPSEPTSPRVVFDSAIGAVVGVIVAAVMLIARTLADQTIYVPEDVEGIVTILGSIPTIEQDGTGRTWRVKIEEKAEHEA